MRAPLLAALLLLVAPGVQQDGPARPEVGDAAPAFRLNDQTGRAVHVRPPEEGVDHPWIVLAFFPKAATPG